MGLQHGIKMRWNSSCWVSWRSSGKYRRTSVINFNRQLCVSGLLSVLIPPFHGEGIAHTRNILLIFMMHMLKKDLFKNTNA